MGLFWDLLQQSQISDTRGRTDDLETRVARLEAELDRARRVIHDLIVVLEQRFGQDLDRDGHIGS